MIRLDRIPLPFQTEWSLSLGGHGRAVVLSVRWLSVAKVGVEK